MTVYTPGAFGNFLAYILDCYRHKTMLESPFLDSGASHNRDESGDNTESWDIIHPDVLAKYKANNFEHNTVIGIHWPQHYFRYVLHASIDRTNRGQYGKSGVAYAEQNFYEFVKKHQQLFDGNVWMETYFSRLKDYFNFECTAENPKVPRIVLRNLLWLNLAAEKTHPWTTMNQLIKDAKHKTIGIETILDYELLRKYLHTIFGFDLDFASTHKTFIEKNYSLREFKITNNVVDAVKNNKDIEIPSLSVVAECIIFYELEKHFFDINFFNLPFYFSNTSEILEYVKHYPSYMKNPNKFFQTNWKDFKNE